ncbi:MAG: 16S rRNA (cytosine(967)-C(5))-methyltransferase RsmB [Clostridiales bacterium]|nr:16S rRNA (cytosine(967)-C(5))-methyltransferase RsmB [Clostridiales bacterium]
MRVTQDEARNTAYRCLMEVLENQGYSNLVLKQELKESSLADRDRAFAVALFYGTITRVYTIDYVLNRFLQKDLNTLDPKVRTCLRMGAWQALFSYGVKDYAAVDSIVSLTRKVSNPGAAGLVNAVLRKVVTEGPDMIEAFPAKRIDLKYSLSKELTGCIVKWYGEEKARSILESFLKEPKVTLRQNQKVLSSDGALIEILAEDGFHIEKDELPFAYVLEGEGMDISNTRAYREGLCSVQSLSAMLVGVLAAPESGWDVLDTCSAPGGKTAHLAEIMGDKGRIDALDANAVRLQMVDETASRLGLTCIRTMPYDATYLPEEMEKLLSEYDLVLTDVPCSGMGLLHRKPDIRLSMSYEKMQSLLPVQKSILENSALRVKRGGYLVYSTCTINPNENEERVSAFLEEHEDFEAVDMSDILPDCLKKIPTVAEGAKRGMITLLPDEGGWDGFFISKMRRKM